MRSSRRAVSSDALVRWACVLGLGALPLMVASVFVPTVWPVLVALSLGQAIGTLSFLLYLVAVVRDLGLTQKLFARRAERSASSPSEDT